MGDMLHNKDFVMDLRLAKRDEVDIILQSVAWTIRTMTNTSTDHSPEQLAFGLDVILTLKIQCDLNHIVTWTRTQTVYDNRKENSLCIRCEYQIGDQILIILSADERRK